MTSRIEMDLGTLERRLNALHLTDSERLEAMAAMRSGYLIVEGCAWFAHKVAQAGASLFSRPTLAR